MTEMLKDAVIGSLWSWLQWLAGQIFHLLGIPGLIACFAGGLLLLSLSARAVRFLNTPRGMFTSAIVLAVSLGFLWWGWQKAATASPIKELASYEPDSRRSLGPIAKVKSETAPPVVASKPVETPAVSGERWVPSPLLAFSPPPPVVAPVITLPAVPLPAVKPVIVPPHHPPHHEAAKPHQTASNPRAAVPARNDAQTAALARQQAMRNAQHARAMAQQQMQMERQFNAMMGFGGMGHMGGMGGMHGGMGHMGGHGGHR